MSCVVGYGRAPSAVSCFSTARTGGNATGWMLLMQPRRGRLERWREKILRNSVEARLSLNAGLIRRWRQIHLTVALAGLWLCAPLRLFGTGRPGPDAGILCPAAGTPLLRQCHSRTGQVPFLHSHRHEALPRRRLRRLRSLDVLFVASV